MPVELSLRSTGPLALQLWRAGLSMYVQISRKHEALVIPKDARIARLFPSARVLSETQMLLPHHPEETRVLRNLGYKVPSPILAHYNWRGTVPFDAQKVTAAMLVCEPRAFVLNGMGTGKTRAVLFAFDYLRRKGMVKKMMVVAPLSTLAFTWGREVFNVMPDYTVGVVHGSKARREKVLADPNVDIFVINHDGVATVKDLISSRKDIDIIVLDECSVYRNYQAKKSKLMVELSKQFSYLWGLTGTPTPRSPVDAYGLIRLINPGAYPGSFKRFRDDLMTPVSTFRWVPKRGSEKKVFDYMQPSVRFTLKDCMDIPAVTYTDEAVTVGPKQKAAYEALAKHGKIMIDQGRINAVNSGVLLNKLLQISAGCVYDSDKNPIVLDAADRLRVVLELVENAEEKVIVFCPYIPIVDMVYEHLKKNGVLAHRIYGATSPNERAKIFSQFQDQRKIFGPECIVAHPKTMSHGLTLTNANMVVWYAPTDDLEIYEQANARIARPGQTSDKVLVKHLVATKTEAAVYKKLKSKQKTQDALLELFEE